MDEDSLKLSIETYNAQLQQVEDALQAAGENDDLQKLKCDLQELIKLTSDSLLSLKKSQLLSTIDSQTTHDTNHESSTSSPFLTQPEQESELNFSSLTKSASTASLEDIHESLEEIAGTKCSAPYTTEWGGTTYYNAMVVCAEPIVDSSELQVRVLFCNPTSSAMLPCQYFLEGSCKFDETKCRYSHGHVVNVTELEKYEEQDYSILKMGATCMAKYDVDNLWYKGTVVEISENHEEIKVLFNQYGNTESVNLHHVIPLDGDTSDSENEKDVIPLNERESDEENDFVTNTQLLNPIKTTDALGEWEKHTKGFGSKLMAKMGYVTGQGLGKNGEGRAEPVPIHLIPQGKSLDQIMELKERAGDANLYDVMKKGNIRHKKIEKIAAKAYNASSSKPKSSDVFDIINKKLGHKKGNLKDLIQPHQQSKKTKSEKVHISEKDLHGKTEKDINIQLLKTSEEVRNVEREISRLETSCKRNKGTDRVAFNQISLRVESLKKYLSQLKGSEASMTSHKKNRKDKKKMTVF